MVGSTRAGKPNETKYKLTRVCHSPTIFNRFDCLSSVEPKIVARLVHCTKVVIGSFVAPFDHSNHVTQVLLAQQTMFLLLQ